MKNAPIIRYVKALGYTIVAFKDTHSVSFKVYETGFSDKGEHMVPVYTLANSDPLEQEETYNLNEANVFMHGDIDWVGQSHWYFDEQNRVRGDGKEHMIYFYSKHDIMVISKIMKYCWSWTKKLIPDVWDYEDATGDFS